MNNFDELFDEEKREYYLKDNDNLIIYSGDYVDIYDKRSGQTSRKQILRDAKGSWGIEPCGTMFQLNPNFILKKAT